MAQPTAFQAKFHFFLFGGLNLLENSGHLNFITEIDLIVWMVH